MFSQGLFFRPWSKLTVASVILLVLAGCFLTAALWLDGQPAVQAQDDRGTVSNLSVSSPGPGQLAVAWSAPGETPTDYRVRWAPSGQDYLAYTEANTAERGSAYPTATTHTVNNLTAGASYKVQVRARYNAGEHADNPWSGPWSAETTVAISSHPPPPTPETTPEPTQEPTPEPTPVPASDEVTGLTLSSETAGQLVITWNQPTEKPTDYRVTWAPADEDFLSYTAENTSRRGNSYPDGDTTMLTLTGLPAGVDYQAMMRARYHDEQTDQHRSGPWTDEATTPSDGETGNSLVPASDPDGGGGSGLSPFARNTAQDINMPFSNRSPEGLWSDGTTMWVADWFDDKLYAYNLSTKERDPGKDFDTLSGAGNNSTTSIWSDGTTMWVADWSDDKLYAYNLSTKEREPREGLRHAECHRQQCSAGHLDRWDDHVGGGLV